MAAHRVPITLRVSDPGGPKAVHCQECDGDNPEGARFCSSCGVAFALGCPTCKAELAPQARFCHQCGTPVEGAGPAPAAPSTAVRKTVTVLFADLGGSTSFGERTDAEIARTVMAEYHAILQRVVDDHGGTVAKFMGDGMMATFGIPEVARGRRPSRRDGRCRRAAALRGLRHRGGAPPRRDAHHASRDQHRRGGHRHR